MPYVNIKITREGATPEQKAELIGGVTELLQRILGKNPATTVVTIDEVYFQCARAIMRADLWNPESFVDPKSLPTPGDLLKAAKTDFETFFAEAPAMNPNRFLMLANSLSRTSR